MAVTTHASGSHTFTGTTETVLTANPETTAGAYQFFFALNAMAGADTVVFRLKEEVQNSSDTQRTFWWDTVMNAQGEEKVWVSPVFMLLNGWDFTVQRTTGASFTGTWSIRKG
jgi:hypothetical protein